MNYSLKKYIKIVCAISFALAISACSNTKFLEKGQFLYTGAKIEVKSDSLGKKEKGNLSDALTEQLRPKPNSSFLGLRPRLYIYNIAKEPTKDKGFKYWLKYKIGEKPVLLSSVDQEFNKKIIVNFSENKGYFNAQASSDTISKNKKAKVIYTLKPGSRYVINKVTFPADSSLVNKEIQKTKSESFLKVGNPFDLDVIKAERVRIDNNLKEKGFYYFSPDAIIVQADSTVTNKQKVELFVKLKSTTPKLAKEQFTIDKTIVFPDYNLQDVKKGKYGVPMLTDSIELYKDLYIVDPEKKFKPRVFDRALYFNKGDLYNRTDHNLSLNRLISLGVFKFVKNEFVISDSLNHKFDAYYLLTPNKFQSLRLETLGKTNSANYTGAELNLNYTHHNFLRGAEQFKGSVFGGFDVQFGGPKDANNIIRLGTKAELSIPRIVAPFTFNTSGAYVPRTNFSLAYEFLNRTQLYTLNNFTATAGYLWKENERKEHELNVVNITYVSPQNVTDKYQQQIDGYFDPVTKQNIPANPSLQRVIDKQLIFGPTYSYTFTNTMLQKKNTVYFKGSADLAGNVTGLLSGADAKAGNRKIIGGIPFSQYVKVEGDFRDYFKINTKTTIASRLIVGLGLPYGNSVQMPYSKQFFVGGSNSIRAFRARTLGPGSYDPRSQPASFFFDESGDIKLEFNTEYRANIYKFLNVAAFVDAGNVWLLNKDSTKPGGQFTKDFLSEVAVGAGLGLRLDFNILVLRLDLATPLRIPYYEKGDRWTFDKMDFGDKQYRKDNLILNIAIGYPF
ncbi:translocation and assembly module lipoprotein TamL [Halpernia frigidisoli]|uniref:Outer membrane protein assembly factor BamA n=1 Tax=Halpernia frigidisoli TaxID=1125876 RepID=A0A1I3GJX1_9FLAO|nr:BamA/TamA family outer membrane protein [Halpernia frigidisoli]SFI23713.1 Outer membrane protein assembly factor BamA [Halpernia frigidisoli]